MRYRIHYANGAAIEIESDEPRASILAWAQPIVDVVALDLPLYTETETPAPKPKKAKKPE